MKNVCSQKPEVCGLSSGVPIVGIIHKVMCPLRLKLGKPKGAHRFVYLKRHRRGRKRKRLAFNVQGAPHVTNKPISHNLLWAPYSPDLIKKLTTGRSFVIR